MLVSDFDFPLPPELIAQHPAAERAASRLLHLRCNAQEFSHDRSPGTESLDSALDATFFSHSIEDLHFRDFPSLLRPTDLLVFNDTKVLPARLFGRRSGQKAQPLSPANPASKDFLQGRVEVLLTRRLPGPEETWQALVRPGRKIMPGERLYFLEEAEGKESGNAALPAAGAAAAGAKVEREEIITVVPKPRPAAPIQTGQSLPPEQPVTLKLDLDRMKDGSERVVASSEDGTIVKAIDIPVAPLPPDPPANAAGLSVGTPFQHGLAEGVWYERRCGRLVLGVEFDHVTTARVNTNSAMVRVGWAF